MELVITVVVMGILAVVGVSMISDSFTTARVVNAGQSNANDARYAVERLAREIREIKHVNKATGYGISTMTGSKLVFTRPDNVVVTIDVNSSNLTLGYSSPATVSTLATPGDTQPAVPGSRPAFGDGSDLRRHGGDRYPLRRDHADPDGQHQRQGDHRTLTRRPEEHV